MDKLCLREICIGCGTCSGVCPAECISMQEQKPLGHIYPVIDTAKCLDCGLCHKICPSNQAPVMKKPGRAYAAWSRDFGDYTSSTSGGAASVLSSKVIEAGGVVYGCRSRGATIAHVRVEGRGQLCALKGSKYVQSRISAALMKQLRKDVKEGRQVLFIGTPCQIAGVRMLFPKEADNLLLVDIICHGVPSQQLLRRHISRYVKVDKLQSVGFRQGQSVALTLAEADGFRTRPLKRDWYLIGFMRKLFYRPACYQCRYARPERVSDITIGDFWGLGALKMEAKPTQGVSAVLINTSKGQRWFGKARGAFYAEERGVEEAVNGNKQLRAPSKRHPFSRLFRLVYPVLGFRASAALCLWADRLAYNILLR